MAKKIVIFSAKGGVGKTLIATNLAVSLAKNEDQKTLLLDMDTQIAGDIAIMLGLTPKKTMIDLIALLKTQSEDFRKEDFLVHHSSGLDFLSLFFNPTQFSAFDYAKIREIFDLFDSEYDYIIVDNGNTFNEISLSVLNQANLILLPLTPDALSIYNTKWLLDTLQLLHFPLEMIKLVLSRAESLASISWQEVRVNFPMVDMIFRIPSDGKSAGQAINKEVPLVIDSPKAKITQAIQKLAKLLVAEEDFYIAHRTLVELTVKDKPLQKSGILWLEEGLAEPQQETAAPERLNKIALLKRRIHNRLIGELNIKRIDLKVFSDEKKMRDLKKRAEIMVSNFLTEETGSFISSPEARKQLVRDILDEALGLGPLEEFLADPTITDIMVNNKDEIYIERQGKIYLTNKKFTTNEYVRTIIERILAPIGRRIDESVPMVDARLADGSRVNAIIPPLSLTGPSLTIRKFRKERFEVDELVKIGTLNKNIADFLKACVISRQNIIISGGTGSGKTTMLNILSSFIPENERIVTLEDAAELKLNQEHWVRLESRSANIEGKGAVTIRDLFRNTLRMRPDRIIIGECRGVETLDMLQAMNTGHDGSMTTIHANSTQDALVRLDSMILMSGVELPIRAIREMVASAINLIIHTARLSDGSRKIIQITEVAGMKDEVHVNLKDIFYFNQTGTGNDGEVLGDFRATGYIPSFIEDIKIRGIGLSDDIFKSQ
jgi:septum site-determining protein MinD